MSSENKRFCNINFIDGKSWRLTYEPVNPDELIPIAKAIQEMSETNNLIFRIEGKLVIVPMNNVRSIEVSPAPANLPRSIIRAQYID